MRISIIIPTLNEADRIADVVGRAQALGDDCEVIVVDGGSDDATMSCAQAADICLQVPQGRASQQNAAVQTATGDVLLFLHADCWLEEGALQAVRLALADESIVGGCFRQAIEAAGMRFRLLEWGNALRVKTCKWAYGDQGIFIRRDIFESLGGFPDVRLMEDLLLMKRLKKVGRIALLEQRIHVSARRWQQRGVIRQTLRNWSLIILAQCGVSPNRLAGFYPHVR
ncbi:MAG: glycosyltransferase family 2 protein [Planctomycetaceae bacterium]|jgi:rSAM/selenodomain-associated transferase 2|nr:glycosyltransferase family 2 protein [Planctomycetaceae bacterium]MBT6487316.1 glycosyltransferase family 2 protein [Planctomycetaceae bacterium]MBT6496316.1 glycosyltransferase family 2 protein [Planctomycetaceae bacterium]